jgi:hypothetical protein
MVLTGSLSHDNTSVAVLCNESVYDKYKSNGSENVTLLVRELHLDVGGLL